MPFPTPPTVKGANAQLNSLISSFTQTSIVGKPLALVNTRWSLELSTPPLEPQQTISSPLINPNETLDQCNIPIKFADASRPFDGLVAYWDIDKDHWNHPLRQNPHILQRSIPRRRNRSLSPNFGECTSYRCITSWLPDLDSNLGRLVRRIRRRKHEHHAQSSLTPLHRSTPTLLSCQLCPWHCQAGLSKLHARK